VSTGSVSNQPIAGPTVGPEAPRSQAQVSVAAAPENSQPPEGPPAPGPTRKPSVGESPQDKPNATPANSPVAATVSQAPPAKPQPPEKSGEKADKAAGGCGDKGAPGEPTPSPTGPQPRWVCAEPKCVIEPLWRGQKAEFVFAISNEGEGDLQIKIKGGWGVKLDGRADRTIAPGQSEQVKVSIATDRKTKGKFTKAIRVTTNDANNPNLTLTCEGTIKVPFEMQPSAISFSEIERGAETQRKTIRITRGEGGPLAPELLPVENENVKASLREIEHGEIYELDVELNPPWPNRAIQAYLTLKTGVAEVPEERIRVYARVAERLRSVPTRFTIPSNVASDLDLKARLIWSGENPGKITEVSSSDPELTASLVEENGEQSVVLHVPEGYVLPSNSRGYVTVRTDDAEARSLRIQMYAARAPQSRDLQHLSATPGKPTLRRINPMRAGVKPTAPGEKPSAPPMKPTVGPTKEPAQPAEKPSKPADKPAKPGEKPAEKPD
jgi:hypothetical protein